LCEEVHQPLLDVPPDHVYRQLPAANKWLKEHEWVSVNRWIQAKLDDDDSSGITATSEDDDPLPRVNLLGTLAAFRPVASGSPSKPHQECCCHIIKAFFTHECRYRRWISSLIEVPPYVSIHVDIVDG
jgi:hypothetical protein